VSKMFEALHLSQDPVEALLPPLSVECGAMDDESAGAAATPPPSTATPRNALGLRTQVLKPEQGAGVLPFGRAGASSEQYRVLRTKIVQNPLQPRVILVSSAGPRDGKTTTSVNLAGAFALKDDGATLLIDGDFRRPAVAHQLRLPGRPGLSNVLAGETALEDAVARLDGYPSLYILQAGNSKRNPTELLDSSAWLETIRWARTIFKHIIIDSPPIGSVADHDLLMAAVDCAIVVVRPDQTDRLVLANALSSLPPEKCLGIVLNCVPRFFLNRYVGYASPHSYYQSAP
jgi:capsular exopolysaccharide synthesis family protein